MRSPKPLDVLAAHRVRAAEGWLELGNHVEAEAELEQLKGRARLHPDVLSTRWRIYVKARKWDACRMVARALTEDVPADPRGWTALAQTFYFEGKVQQAYEVARDKIHEFTHCWPLLYNMARYACLLGKRADAEQFLHLAMSVGDPDSIRKRSLADPALKLLAQED